MVWIEDRLKRLRVCSPKCTEAGRFVSNEDDPARMLVYAQGPTINRLPRLPEPQFCCEPQNLPSSKVKSLNKSVWWKLFKWLPVLLSAVAKHPSPAQKSLIKLHEMRQTDPQRTPIHRVCLWNVDMSWFPQQQLPLYTVNGVDCYCQAGLQCNVSLICGREFFWKRYVKG